MASDLMQIFKWGVDYGLLLAEQERDSEDLADAFQGVVVDEKYSMPSCPARRRMPAATIGGGQNWIASTRPWKPLASK